MTPDSGYCVVVGMSGGVDSSVAAALLKDQGYDVIGVMLRLWSEPGTENRCCAPDALEEARSVSELLGIPFYELDVRDEFYQAVVLPFVDGYAQGRTPNPCLNCNRFIRWKTLLHKGAAVGASYLATGHYARVQQTPEGTFQLLKALDQEKDQSYVLHILDQSTLSKTLLPLGELTKSQVRKLAEDYSLPVAERPDSQDLCFVGQGNYRDFLRGVNPDIFTPGPILDLEGNHLGEHRGLADFTIGQRKGLRVAGPEPLYVIRKDIHQNALIVGTRNQLGGENFYVDRVNWIAGKPPQESIQASVKIRYTSREIPATVHPKKKNTALIQLSSPLPDITPGQAAVFYSKDLCLGGGIIRAGRL